MAGRKHHPGKTKRGFTLPELLVAIACAAVLLLGVCSAVAFFTGSGSGTMEDASATYQLPTIRDYITANAGTDDAETLGKRFTVEDGTLKDTTQNLVIAKDAGIDRLTFTETADGLIKCDMVTGNYHYVFTVIPDINP